MKLISDEKIINIGLVTPLSKGLFWADVSVRVAQAQLEACEKEAQEKVDSMIEEIEDTFEDVTGKDSIEQILAIAKHRWQALKQKHGVKK